MIKKNIVPVVFCFDDNLEMQAGVCITSLLINADKDTFYDIYILHSEEAKFVNGKLNDLLKYFDNCKINYRSVGNSFKGAYEIRGITYAAYYRLLIPELIPEYDKIFYFDVDIIFQRDLYILYVNTDMEEYLVGGVSTPYSDISDYVNKEMGMQIDRYICSGTILLNSKRIIEENIIPQFIEVAKKRWKYQDQDTLNYVCKDRIKILPPWFGVVGTVSEIASSKSQTYYSELEVNEILRYGIIHYNGPKPWKEWCLNFDVWWEYYRKSIFFDKKYYYDFFNSRINDYDRLSLLKRFKILLRYFKNGQLK